MRTFELMPDLGGYDPGPSAEPIRLTKYTVLGTPEPDIDDFDTESQESVAEAIYESCFDNIDDPTFVETRQPNGFHCMDYETFQPGIQLPGGLTETMIFLRLMSPSHTAMPMSQEYQRAVLEMLDGGVVSYHHNKCAAARHKRDALSKNFVYEAEARDFTYNILDELELIYQRTDRDIETGILTGAQRAEDHRIWDVDFEREKGTAIARSMGAPFEELKKDGSCVPIGLRVNTSPHLFNSANFRQAHVHEAKELGVYNVDFRPFRDWLAEQGIKDLAIARRVGAAALFTHGLAKHVGDEYLRAALVKGV